MKVAIIVPRYGPDVPGGAEAQARRFAEEGVRRGWQMEVWTSRARDQFTWEHVYPEGSQLSRGVLVRRFPATCCNPDLYAELDIRLVRRGYLSVAEQYTWLESGIHSAALYDHVARHAAEFDVVIALPYTVALVHYAAWLARERVVIWPCLHDEQYAYLEPVRLLLESAWGVMFNSPEESQLAVRRLGIRPRQCAVLGEGVSLALPAGDPSAPPVQSQSLLYVGRLEEGKNLDLLYSYARRYADEAGTIRLVVLGYGPLGPWRHPAFEYRGFVSEQAKAQAYRSALALCQPSINESFSLTIMEAWLAARPVLVHADCAVTCGHTQRSKGGLWFRTYDEFAAGLEWLQSNPAAAARMGQNGRQYVLSNYTPEAVASRFERLVQRWKGEHE